MKVGFIGLGIMGIRMAANLLAKGHTLVLYNRTQEKAQTLIAQGAAWADSPAGVAQQVEVLVTMLAHPEAVKAYALGQDGFLDALPADSIWMDSSTVNPSFSREMAEEATRRHIRFLDAPVMGSKAAAENAQLNFLVGGAQTDLEAVTPLMNAMGQRITYVGETGMGASLKMVMNMLLATTMATFVEGMALGHSLGISQEVLLKMLIGAPVLAPFIAAKQDKMTSGVYDTDFPLQWMHKDLHLATVSAYETGAPMLLAAMAKEMYRQAIEAGFGEQDYSALYASVNTGR